MSAKELGDYLGVSAAAVRNWARSGEIPYYRIRGQGGKRGGTYVFRVRDVLRVMNNPLPFEDEDDE